MDGGPDTTSIEMLAAPLWYTRRVPVANSQRGVLMKASQMYLAFFTCFSSLGIVAGS